MPEPRPGPGEALVRVRLAGVCATDLEILKGYMGFRGVLGHEFVGVVEGPAGHPLRGRRVVGEINCGCGRCALCAGGLERHCPARGVLGILNRDGAFAEYVALPDRNLHPVPEGVPDEAAVFCEPLAACFEPLEQRPGLARGRVLVVGDGRLGLLQAQVFRQAGAEAAVLGRHPAKLALLDGQDIARFTDPAGAGRGGRWPVVVEATGSAQGFCLALSLTAPRGVLVLKSTVAGAAELNLAPVVIDEIEVVGSRCGPFAPALAALASGRVRTAGMIHARYPLARGLEALARAGERGTLKVLLEP
ncbi:MAG: alcohol dehydrogenase catalytic domain-containing protein [Nitrospinota bacterium]